MGTLVCLLEQAYQVQVDDDDPLFDNPSGRKFPIRLILAELIS